MPYKDYQKRLEDSRAYYWSHREAKRAYGRKWYQEHKEQEAERRRRYRLEDPQKIRDQRVGSRLKRLYGLTLDDYNKLLLEQGGVCAACGASPNGKRLAVDHNHKTGSVRGLLCFHCNSTLGKYKDNPDNIIKLASYLVRQETGL